MKKDMWTREELSSVVVSRGAREISEKGLLNAIRSPIHKCDFAVIFTTRNA